MSVEYFGLEVKGLVKVAKFDVPEGLYYSKDHFWVSLENGNVKIGVSDYAQKQLREIVFVELPSEGDTLERNEPFGTLESVKAVSDLIAPLSGSIQEVNEEVGNNPEVLNEDPYGEGWLLMLSPTNLDEELKELMDFEKAVKWYKELTKEG